MLITVLKNIPLWWEETGQWAGGGGVGTKIIDRLLADLLHTAGKGAANEMDFNSELWREMLRHCGWLGC